MVTSDRLFDIDGVPEAPLFREPARKGAARGAALDARFLNDYPPEWHRCETCGRAGTTGIPPGHLSFTEAREGGNVVSVMVKHLPSGIQGFSGGGGSVLRMKDDAMEQVLAGLRLTPEWRCPDCFGMGSLKARVRLEAGHRCVRCLHPYMPKGDAAMLGVKPSGMGVCPGCDGWGRITDPDAESGRCQCDGSGVAWTPWSACDEQCTHGAPIRWRIKGQETWQEIDRHATPAEFLDVENCEVEAEWRILTVHHLDGDKANCRWWNLAALCQRCHLEIQAKVVMERVYPFEHSAWFKPFVAGYYAWVYLGEDLTRAEAAERRDELLALERQA